MAKKERLTLQREEVPEECEKVSLKKQRQDVRLYIGSEEGLAIKTYLE